MNYESRHGVELVSHRQVPDQLIDFDKALHFQIHTLTQVPPGALDRKILERAAGIIPCSEFVC